MTRAHQLIAVVRACFRPASPLTLIGVSAYGAYLAWLAMREIDVAGNTAYIHLCLALATAGAWIGACVGRAARWPGSRFTPAFIPMLGFVAAFAAVSALGLNGATAWIGGLDPWPLAALGTLATAAGLAGGCAQPSLTKYLCLCVLILVPLTPLLGPDLPLPIHGAEGAVTSVVALAGATALLVRFAFRLRGSDVTSPSSSALSRPWWPARAGLLPNRLSEPSMGRIAFTSGILAVGCTFAHRLPGLEWRDAPLIVVIGSVCANLGATATSISLPRGPLPGVAWLLLSGAAKTRSAAARRMLWGIVGDSLFAAGVFAAITIALGPDWDLVAMMLVTLAACHTYLAAACRCRWLLSSRLSVLVATPAVVAIAWAAWAYGPWDLPTALAACMLSAIAAVYLGGLGMGCIDLDLAPHAEPAP